MSEPSPRETLVAATERLVEVFGRIEARAITAEMARRMGSGGTSAEWLQMMLTVVLERHPEAGPANKADN